MARTFDDYIGFMEDEQFCGEVLDRSQRWNDWTVGNGLQRQWMDNFRLYYNAEIRRASDSSFSSTSFELQQTDGDIVRMRMGFMRNVITHLLNMTVTAPPALDTIAANDDADSKQASQLFKSMLDFYFSTWNKGQIPKCLHKAVELSLVMSNGYLFVEWDPFAGKQTFPDELGIMQHEGDLSVKAKTVWDVVFDTCLENESEMEWIIIRDFVNRYELAARYPDFKDEIMSVPAKQEGLRNYGWSWDNKTDLIPLYKFFHRSSVLLPQGRMAFVLDGATKLYDGPNPYIDENGAAMLPVVTIRASDGLGTLYGYSPANDISPIQQAMNILWSAVMTNQAATAVQNFYAERGADYSTVEIAGALTLIEGNKGFSPPQPLNLSATSPQTVNMINMLESWGEKLSGANSVVRGSPDKSIEAASGRALGLIQAMAVQFTSGLQASYANGMRDLGNMILRILRSFVKSERVTSIVGKNKILSLSTWSGETFKNVGSVIVEPVNPITKTLGGKQDLAEWAVKSGLVTVPEEMITLMNTGRIEPLMNTTMSTMNLIAQENEKLSGGQMVPVLMNDKHALHLEKHRELTDSVETRMNSAALQVILQHMQEHMNFANAQSGGPQPGAMPGAPPNPNPPNPGAEPQIMRNEQPAMGPGGTPIPIPDTANVPPPTGMQ